MRRILSLLLIAGIIGLGGCDEKSKSTRSARKPNSTNRVELLEFSATWCEPCREQKPIVEDLEHKYPKVDFRYIDVDEDEALARMYGVNSVPRIFILIDGKIADRFVGLQSRERLVHAIEMALREAARGEPKTENEPAPSK
jgi:thioredoxin 1